MFRTFTIALAITAFATAAAIETGALSNVPFGREAERASRNGTPADVLDPAPQQVYRQTASCRLTQRQIAVYRSSVPRLDTTKLAHRRVAPIYYRAWRAEQAWYDNNCP